MICAEELRIYLYLIGFIAVGIWIIIYASNHPDKAIKLLLIAATAVLFLVGTAGAESFDYFLVEEIVKVEPTILDEELVWEVSFDYHGEILSWYEDAPLDDTLQYVVKIDEQGRVVNSASL